MVKFTITSNTGEFGLQYEAGEDKNERLEFLKILSMIFLDVLDEDDEPDEK